MAIRNNPVRGQYMLVGSDLVRAGIVTIGGVVQFIREFGQSTIVSADPANERWVTSRAVASAASKLNDTVDLASVPYNAQFAALLKADPHFQGFHLTRDHIIHMLPNKAGNPDNVAYAEAQVAALEVTYGVTAGAAAA